jgi:hypothetical protein
VTGGTNRISKRYSPSSRSDHGARFASVQSVTEEEIYIYSYIGDILTGEGTKILDKTFRTVHENMNWEDTRIQE